jgi:hypothetical protein
VTTTPKLDIRRLVVAGSARRPELEQRLNRAADILKYDPPRHAGRDSRLWLVPSEQRENVLYLVDRLNGTCQCPDYGQYANWRSNGTNRPPRGAPAGWCKHRLAVEMICRLSGQPDPEPEPAPAPAPGLDWHRQNVSAEAAQCPYLALMW